MFGTILRLICATALGLMVADSAMAQPNDDAALRSLKACLSAPTSGSTEDFMNGINPALNAPDKVSWCLFLYVNSQAATADNNNALFETWASDGDTFQVTPAWPSGTSNTKPLRRPVLPHLAAAPEPAPPAGPTTLVLPVQTTQCKAGELCVGEEVRRNRATFDFIVKNTLFTQAGLRAYGKTITFPADSIEVKANWVPVSQLAQFPDGSGSPADPSLYHVNTTTENGQRVQYALLSFHIISKIVPNWTWATFEHMNNPGRCDYIGCADKFGATEPFMAPHSLRTVGPGKQYTNCTKTPALTSLFAAAGIDPKFANYCLKGSQTDFTDATGVPTRVGNSITEGGFVATASCISCHARAAFSFVTGTWVSNRIFIYRGDTPIGNLGPIDPGQFWMFPQSDPVQGGNAPVFLPADFVWSLSLCAVDSTGKSACAVK